MTTTTTQHEHLFRQHQTYIEEAREMAPTWAEIAEDDVETLYSPAACERLAATAPTEYLAGLWMGKALALRQLQSLTERFID